MDQPKKPPSLQDFDYFSDEVQPPPSAEAAHAEPDLDEAPTGRPVARAIMTLITTTVFLGVTGWFLWGYWDSAVYAFMEPHEPLRMGDVAEMTPDQIKHNSYVTVHGITEHRGLRQTLLRGLSMSQREYWYFRLLGSRGVFIEVEPDASKYGFTTEVTVTGRAVDPALAPMYRDLLHSYEDIFASENKAHTRIIQVNVRPGEGRMGYAVALAALGGLALANLLALMRLLRQLAARIPGD